MADGPLSGVRVLDLSTILAGPLASSLLGEFGADVIKVEYPGEGDPARSYPPLGEDGVSAGWAMLGRTKRSVTIDLHHPEAANLVGRLAATADVVVTNFRPATLRRFRIDFDDLRAYRPDLVMVHVSAFGRTGPYAERPGFARVVGLAAGVSADEVTKFFPSDFFVLIVGVTALFAAAQLNGTLDWLLDLLRRLVGGRLVLVALVPFVVGAVLTALGTLPAAATAIVAPIALGLAARYGISPLVAAVLGITGIISGLLSPLAVYGVTARQLGTRLGIGLPSSAPVTFLLGGLLTGLVVAAACLAIGSRTGAVPPGRLEALDPAPDTSDTTGSRAARVLTVSCLLAVVVLSVGFDMNIGYLGLTAALLLQLALRLKPGAIVSRIPWNVVLLIGGLLTYVGLMQRLGTFRKISDLLHVEGSPALSLLVLCYVAGVTSFAASSIAVFVTTMPLLPPLVAEGVSPVGGVLALALASVLVDINPLGITGGLILGAAEPAARPRLFRHLLTYGVVSVVVAPVLAWLAFGSW